MKKYVTIFITILYMHIAAPSVVYAGSVLPGKFNNIAVDLNTNIGSKICKIALGVQGTLGRAMAVIAVIIFGAAILLSPFGQIRIATLNFAAILAAAVAVTTSASAIADMLSNKVILGANSTLSNCAGAMVKYYTTKGDVANYYDNDPLFFPGLGIGGGLAVPGSAIWDQVKRVADNL